MHGAYATLTFNGTAVWIYGAKRGNHGPYNITLDGNNSEYDGYYDGDMFQQVLFSAVGLDATTPHTASMINWFTNATRPYFGIDFVSTPLTTRFKPPIKRDLMVVCIERRQIVYQMEIPDDYEEVRQQDTDNNFQYSPSAWSTDPENLWTYDGSTGQ